MAYKFVEEQVETSPNKLGTAARTLLGGATRFAENLASMAAPSPEKYKEATQFVEKLTGQPTPEPIKELSQGFRTPFGQAVEATGIKKEQLEPEGFWETAAQNLISSAPYLFRPGVSQQQIVEGLKRIGAGAVTGAGIKQLGGGETAQAIGQLAGELGTGIVQKGGLPSGIKKMKEGLYSQAKEAITPGEQAFSTNTRKEIRKIDKVLKTTIDADTKSKLESLRDTIGTNLDEKFGVIGLEDAWELKKELNRLKWRGKAKTFKDDITKAIKSDLEQHGKINPKFWESLQPADALHEAEKMNNVITEMIHSVPVIKKWSFLPTLTKTIDDVVLFGPRMFKSPTFRKTYGKIAAAAFNENLPQLIKYGPILNKLVESEKENLPKGFRFVED